MKQNKCIWKLNRKILSYNAAISWINASSILWLLYNKSAYCAWNIYYSLAIWRQKWHFFKDPNMTLSPERNMNLGGRWAWAVLCFYSLRDYKTIKRLEGHNGAPNVFVQRLYQSMMGHHCTRGFNQRWVHQRKDYKEVLIRVRLDMFLLPLQMPLISYLDKSFVAACSC